MLNQFTCNEIVGLIVIYQHYYQVSVHSIPSIGWVYKSKNEVALKIEILSRIGTDVLFPYFYIEPDVRAFLNTVFNHRVGGFGRFIFFLKV